MFSSGRLMACHKFYYGCKDLFRPGSRLHLTGHSLGGTLALELLRNSLCNATYAPYDPKCIVFNPGYVFEQRHYRFLNYNYWGRVTVLRMCNDVVSHGLLRSKFHENERVWTFVRDGPPSYNPIDPHFMSSFDEFAEFHYNDRLRSAEAASATVSEAPPANEQLVEAYAEIDDLIAFWERRLATRDGPAARTFINKLRKTRKDLPNNPDRLRAIRRKLARLRQIADKIHLSFNPSAVLGSFVDLCVSS
jgi:alpha-beta hydrolase superfamily lysophospholipase